MIDQSYEQGILNWRLEMDASLRAEKGWLSLAGLFWLKEGMNSFGSGASNDIVLPGVSAPQEAGCFRLSQGKVTLRVAAGSIAVDGESVVQSELKPDTSGSPSRLTLGDQTMMVIQRGERFGIRLWDDSRPERRTFPGRQWYPVRPEYRVEARFLEHDPPRSLQISDISGGLQEASTPGTVTFEVHGQQCQMEALGDPEEELFLIFRDLTCGEGTYPGGRFLTTERPERGEVCLDFNRAYSPPCAFTPFATCPLPPQENYLRVRIEAGELHPEEAH